MVKIQKRHSVTNLMKNKEKEKMKTLYKVKQAVIGADRTDSIYFETKEEAEKYYETHNYVDMPRAVRVTDEHAKEFVADSLFILYEL